MNVLPYILVIHSIVQYTTYMTKGTLLMGLNQKSRDGRLFWIITVITSLLKSGRGRQRKSEKWWIRKMQPNATGFLLLLLNWV